MHDNSLGYHSFIESVKDSIKFIHLFSIDNFIVKVPFWHAHGPGFYQKHCINLCVVVSVLVKLGVTLVLKRLKQISTHSK